LGAGTITEVLYLTDKDACELAKEGATIVSGPYATLEEAQAACLSPGTDCPSSGLLEFGVTYTVPTSPAWPAVFWWKGPATPGNNYRITIVQHPTVVTGSVVFALGGGDDLGGTCNFDQVAELSDAFGWSPVTFTAGSDDIEVYVHGGYQPTPPD